MAVLSTARLQEIYEVRNQCSTHVEAAEILGISESTLREHLKNIKEKAARGELGFKPVLPGFQVESTTEHTNGQGGLVGRHVRQVREHTEKLIVPEGQELMGLSAFTDANNNIIGQWHLYRKGKGEESLAVLRDAIRASFDEYKGASIMMPKPRWIPREDLLSVYNLGDHHLGLAAWGKEVGYNCDLEIGKKLLLDTVSELVAGAPKSKKCIILSLGDFFHANGKNAITERSGNLLDRDGRFAKIYRVGVDLAIWMINLTLQKHELVEVRFLPGNHDETSSFTLSVALSAFFHNEPRVKIDLNPSLVWCYQFDKVMLAATHGHEITEATVAGHMAVDYHKIWGDTDFRYAYLGHLHHKNKIASEHHGAIIETFQILPPQDSFNSKFPLTGRSMPCITHHHLSGEYLRHTVNIVPGVFQE